MKKIPSDRQRFSIEVFEPDHIFLTNIDHTKKRLSGSMEPLSAHPLYGKSHDHDVEESNWDQTNSLEQVHLEHEPLLHQQHHQQLADHNQENGFSDKNLSPSHSERKGFRIYKDPTTNHNSTASGTNCFHKEENIHNSTSSPGDFNKNLEHVSPNTSSPSNHSNCEAALLPMIAKRMDIPNASSLKDHIQLTSEVQFIVKSPQRTENHPHDSFSVSQVLNKAGLPIKKNPKLGNHWSRSSIEKLPLYSKGASSPSNQCSKDEVSTIPNTDPTFHSPVSKPTILTKHPNSLSRLQALSIPKKVTHDKDFLVPDNYVDVSSSFPNSSSHNIKQWHGLSEKDEYVHSLISNSQDEEELHNLKYELGSMISYENSKTKPPLLETMENFIHNELQYLKSQLVQDNNEMEFQIAKAQVYKECMNIFIDHSKTYGPILSTVVHEFSTTIEYLRDHLMSLSKKNESINIKDENAVKMHRLYRETSNENTSLKKENEELEKQVAVLKSNEKALLHTVDKLGMDIKLHEKRMIDEIKREMLLNDAIQHRELREVEITKKLNEMKSAVQEKTKMERMYFESMIELDKRKDMVPKGDYQKLKTMHDQLEKELESLKVKFCQEQRVSKLLHEKVNEVMLTNNVLEEKLLDLSRSHTPRPKWQEIRQGLKLDSLPLDSSTAGNVNQLLQRMTKLQALIRKQQRELQENATALEFLKTEDIIKSGMYSSCFIGQGTGPNVPKYLRFRGKVRNKRYRKKEIMNVLNEVWKFRAKSRENQNQPRESFDDFFDGFISMKLGKVGSIRAELAYNIVFGCEHYSWDMDCCLFLKILRNEISELAYFAMKDMIDKLHNAFVKLDETEGGRAKGTVLKKNANKLIEVFFQGKLEEDILKLKVDMHKDQPNHVMNYEKLFQPDSDGFDSRFLTTVKRQFISDVEEYSIDCAEWLRKKEEREGTLSVRRVYEIFDKKQVSKNSLENTIRIGLDLGPEEDICWEQPVNIDTFMKNIQAKMLLTRTTYSDNSDSSVSDFDIEKELEAMDANQEIEN